MLPIAAVVVAAGSSSRLGQPKQLLMVDGEPMLQRAIRLAGEAGASPLLAVLGAHQEMIERGVDFTAARIVVNHGWQEGIASSIRAGIEALRGEVPDAPGVMLLASDQPRVTAQHLRRMIVRFAQSQGAAVASFYAGTRGVPAIFPRTAFPDLMALHGDKGARGLLQRPPWPVEEVPFEGGEVDIDRPEDLANLP